MDVSPKNVSRCGLEGSIWMRRAKGASFCQVEITIPVNRSTPWRTSGSHACSGASPIFRASARVTRITAIGLGAW